MPLPPLPHCPFPRKTCKKPSKEKEAETTSQGEFSLLISQPRFRIPIFQCWASCNVLWLQPLPVLVYSIVLTYHKKFSEQTVCQLVALVTKKSMAFGAFVLIGCFFCRFVSQAEASGLSQSHEPDRLSVLPLWISLQTVGEYSVFLYLTCPPSKPFALIQCTSSFWMPKVY